MSKSRPFTSAVADRLRAGAAAWLVAGEGVTGAGRAALAGVAAGVAGVTGAVAGVTGAAVAGGTEAGRLVGTERAAGGGT